MKKSILNLLVMITVALLAASCGSSGNIDKDCYKNICGEYQAVERQSDNDEDYVGGWWHLSIGDNDENGGKAYLSIYDNGAGNPGVEGTIVNLDEESITIKINEEYYDEMPSFHWKEDGKNLVLDYEITDKGIELTNNDAVILFRDESLPVVYCGHWKSPDSDELTGIDFSEGSVTLEGWYMDDQKHWDNVPTSIFLADNCKYIDKFLGKGEVSCEEFQKILAGDDVAYSVIELELVDNEVSQVRLVEPDESIFNE